jgi:hypothetical protein
MGDGVTQGRGWGVVTVEASLRKVIGRLPVPGALCEREDVRLSLDGSQRGSGRGNISRYGRADGAAEGAKALVCPVG